jgi:hypothetical protein
VADDFGTPDADDATSRGEKTVMEAAQYIVDLGEKAKSEVQNRDLGSVKISPQQRKQEWGINFQAAEAGDPSLLAKFYVDQKASVEDMVAHAKEMLK